MKRVEKAAKVMDILGELYPKPPIPLDHTDPYTLLVAVMLSAQTTDKKVNEVTPSLFEVADTPDEMRKLSVNSVKDLIKQIGLAPQKAKNLVGLSERIVDVFGGEVPRTFEDLESLPGVGHKTASVVMAQAFGVPAFPVDTHIHRLAARWGLSTGKSVEKTEQDLKSVFPESRWNDLHLQIIYFGREYCPARRHDLSTCRICGWAASKKRMLEEQKMNAPRKRARKKAS